MNLRSLLQWSYSVVFATLFCTIGLTQNDVTVNYQLTDIQSNDISFMGFPQITASNAKYYEINPQEIANQLIGIGHREHANSGFNAVIQFPHPDGTMHSYRAVQNSTLHKDLALKFPEIRSYDAQGIDEVANVKWDITPQGLHVMIMRPGESTIYIDPVFMGDDQRYIVYNRADFQTTKSMQCLMTELGDSTRLEEGSGSEIRAFGDCQLHSYRIAIAATGEYTQYHGGTVALAQAAQVTTMNRVNGVYERDMAITMSIIPNNDLIVYTDGATDPYSNGNPGNMINENQANCDAVIGSANYDVGHVFGTNSGGLAGLGVVCTGNQKARGVTGSANPIGDPFDIDYVSHELGHQFGANHTFNNSCNNNRNNATAVEPGSGNTIMAYAGICAPNTKNFSDDHFSGISLQEIDFEIASHTCEVLTPLANNPPTITGSNANVTIPISTPFVLTAIANDVDGDALTYNWEQMNNEISAQSPDPTSTGGPNFISNPSLTSPSRYMPNLVDLASGGPFTWEVLPSVTRSMDFRCVVKDNVAGGGCNDHIDVTITTDANSGPFVVLYPSNTGITWNAFNTETVTWDVANTDIAPVSCANVDILLSTDGGLTYPITLATNVPNDGSEAITVPNVGTTTARLMVICSSGTFFDISDNDFTIVEQTNGYTMSTTPGTITVCQPNDAVYTIDIGSIGGYNDPVTLSVSGLPVGATSSFSMNPVTPAGTSVLTISNTGSAAPGDYTLTIDATSTSGPQSNTVQLSILSNIPAPVTLTSPTDGATNVGLPVTFNWTAGIGAGITYDIEISTDAGFSTIIDQATGLATNSYTSTILSAATTYYWHVNTITPCGNSGYSTTFSFTTDPCQTFVSTDVPKNIPGQGTPTITSILNVPMTGSIIDVNVLDLFGQHQRISDVTILLTSPQGTSITLMDQPCNQQDDWNLDYDDAAASPNIPCPPTDGLAYQPVGLLSDFNTEDPNGVWTLTVIDNQTGRGGSLDGWSLQICVAPAACVNPDVPTIGGTTTICDGSSTTLSVTAGNLNSAADWEWYEGSCGGTSVGSGGSVTLSPTITTTYYIRGEGNCVTPGACQQITVTVNPTFNSTDAATICQGDSYTFGTQTLTSAGTYTEVFTAMNGCDSTVVLTLTVNPTYNTNDAASICDGDTYVFGTQNLTAQGTYTEVFTAINGCDSTVILNLTVNPVYNETDAATICTGDSYIFGTQTLTASGTYTEVFFSVDGCDSIVLLTLTVVNNFTSNDAVSICQGDSYIFGTQTLTTAGTYNETFISVGGCDSIVTLVLTVNPTYNTNDAATICQGDSYIFGTQALTTVGSYTEVFSSVDGCDSTVMLTLTVNPTFNTNDAATICQGDSYNFGTQTLTIAGTYTEVFTTVNGCDSTVTLTLTVNPIYNENTSASICQGESYTFGTQTLTAAGTYTELFSSVDGCDSLVVLTLSVNSGSVSNESASICDGDAYFFGTQVLTSAGTYTEVFTGPNGCDSTVILTITVSSSYTIQESASICPGESYQFGSQTLLGPGTYVENYTTVDGCDSTVVLTLSEYPSYSETTSATICQGESYVFGTQNLTSSGTYSETFMTVDGCDSTVFLTLTVNGIDVTVTQQNYTLTSNQAGAAYQWLDCDNNYALIPGATNQSYTPGFNGNFAVKVDLNNCTDTSECINVDIASIEAMIAAGIEIFPNPVEDQLTITWTESVQAIKIKDAKGRLIDTFDIGSLQELTIDVSSLSGGIYFLNIHSNDGFIVKDIMKK